MANSYKLSKSLGKQIEQDLEQAYHRYTKEKGLSIFRKFWDAIANDEKLLIDLGKTIIAKTTPTESNVNNTGEALVDQSLKYTVQIVRTDGSKTEVPFTRKPVKSMGESGEV